MYDFGDGWVDEIKLENSIEDYKFGYPTLVAGEGACQQDDVGGISGYEEFLEVMNNPELEEYESAKLWGEGKGIEILILNLRIVY